MRHFNLVILVLVTSSLLAADRVTVEQGGDSQPVIRIVVDPHSTRSIGGQSVLDRNTYFSISDPGTGFDDRTRSEQRYRYLADQLRVCFGRRLGVVSGPAGGGKAVGEDPNRPGMVDLDRLRSELAAVKNPPSAAMLRDFGPRLDVAAHGKHNAFPRFMGTYVSSWLEQHGDDAGHRVDRLPKNIEAAAELSAAVLKYGYNNFDRPRYYEPVNEPHWSYMTEPEHLSKWHLATMRRVHADVPGVLVGGPCNSVGYLYSQNYRSFGGVRNFIDATSCEMDFYSFHVYDYYTWDDGRFGGAILSGLPLEGVLDLVPNYTSIKYGAEVAIVVSEQGGYLPAVSKSSGAQNAIEQIAQERFPGSGFEWQMKARSIHDFIQTNSMIANTLVFMDHPHVLKKAVPFVLLEASAWDPTYYATLYTPADFDPRSEHWVPSTLHDFYRLFRDIEGRRVVARCPDPDVLVRAFVHENRLFVIAHNLAEKPEQLEIASPLPKSADLRRYGSNDDLTPFLRDETETDLSLVALGPRETIVITAEYDKEIVSQRTLKETAHYGNAVTVPVQPEATITISIPTPRDLQFATLRIGYNRPHATGRGIRVVLNGEELAVPVEDSAFRYDHEKHGYSTTKLIPVDPAILRGENQVTISFPDGGRGTVGSAVLRTMR